MPDVPAERVARLYAATTALTGAHDESDLLGRIVREAAGLTHARYAALGLLRASRLEDGASSGDAPELIRFVTHGLTDEEYAALKDHPPHGRGILGALLREGRPLRLDSLSADPRSVGFPANHPHMDSFLGVPLELAGDVIGRLYMTESDRGTFSEEDEQLALGFAAAAAVAIASTRASASLVIAAARLRSVLDALERGVCMTDASGIIVLANEPLSILLGLETSPLGLREREFSGLFVAPEAFLSALGVEQAQPMASSTEYFELRDGVGRSLRRFGAPVLASDGTWLGRLAVYSDMTRDLEMQEQLVTSERLRATGEMAAGVAHDFNNLLATILGRVEVMLGDLPQGPLRENLIAVQRAARDGAATVARMREYGRPLDAGEFHPVSLEEVVRQAVELTQPRWRDQAQREGRTVDVQMRLQPTRPVSGDAAALREVLVNLVFNAVDAMPDGGRLTFGLVPAGAGAELTVRDSGHGMSQAVQRRIFEPFFTTKGDKGSGLGLAMARKVIIAHGGRIDVESAPGLGTTFKLWLPTTDAPLAALTDEAVRRAPGRIARIVVVDDQKDVLETTAMLLRADGHDVRAFDDPRTAVAAVAADPPDLVISDLGMPGMNGWDVARAVHHAHADVPVVLLTGWGREISAQQMREGGIAAVLPKPVEGRTLLETVEALLPRDDQPLRVLLVDDSAAFAAVLAMLIAQGGHDVRRAESAAAGLAALAEDQFDLVIVDLGLPDRPAVDVLAAARSSPRVPALCVVSGSSQETMERDAPGADLYVEKVRVPERLDDLVQIARARAGNPS